jgi:hypothetical protein
MDHFTRRMLGATNGVKLNDGVTVVVGSKLSVMTAVRVAVLSFVGDHDTDADSTDSDFENVIVFSAVSDGERDMPIDGDAVVSVSVIESVLDNDADCDMVRSGDADTDRVRTRVALASREGSITMRVVVVR